MTVKIDDHQLNTELSNGYYIPNVIEAFLVNKKVQNLSIRTVENYKEKLMNFWQYCESQEVKVISQIDTTLLRRYFLRLEETGHNAGGISGFYRPIKTLLRWYEFEFEPEGWNNPIRKIKPPKVKIEPLEPIPLENIKALLSRCDTRDRAILLFLLDTGCRAREALGVDRSNINLLTGEILIVNGKGGKPRHVYIGKTTRKALRAYLNKRKDNHPALFISRYQDRLDYDGLRSMIRRRSQEAGIDAPAIHGFRRTFAINMLRAGVDVFTLQRLMGHADLQILRRYLAQTDNDLREAHNRASPGDRL